MDTTPNLSLPYLMAAQAQKHVTHNEAIRALDALVQMAVIDRDLATPPPTPVSGARYIVGATPTGTWSGRAMQIAAWQDGGWEFYLPREGWVAWVADEDKLYAFDGTAWMMASSGGGGGGSVNPTPLVGINATADASNRLSVAAPAILFSHEGTDHRLKINKATAANTASLLYQTAFSGRAEVGLTGDDNLHLKVSADGTVWREAMVVDRATAVVSLPFTNLGGVNGNLLINGDFQVNQRGFSGGALGGGVYGFDRWKADGAGASLTLAGFAVTLVSGIILQPVETALWGVASFASTAVTVSVDAPSADLTVVFGSAIGTITAGPGRRSVLLTTAPGDTGNLALKLSKATAGTVTFGRVKLEFGNAATVWQARSRADELHLAKRYHQKVGGQALGDIHVRAYAGSGSYLIQSLQLPVEMRVAPTGSVAGTWDVINTSVTAPILFTLQPKAIRLAIPATATGDTYFSTIDGTTFVTLTAEI